MKPKPARRVVVADVHLCCRGELHLVNVPVKGRGVG